MPHACVPAAAKRLGWFFRHRDNGRRMPDFATLGESLAVRQQWLQDAFIAVQQKAQIGVAPAGERTASQNGGSA
jgi:hypothetical protein